MGRKQAEQARAERRGGSEDLGTQPTLPAAAAPAALGPERISQLVTRPVDPRCLAAAAAAPGAAEAAQEALTREHPGRYEIGGEIGAGGIGKIYLAFDRHLGRHVALKELLPDPAWSSRRAGALFTEGPTVERTPAELRFVNEARITGQLEHPSIVPVYELGRRAGDEAVYYAMRLVRGRTLAQALRERDLAGRLELLPHFADVCNAVAYAHSRGVIHRDLKPDNVMLGDFGETVLLDWGLAKVRGHDDVQSAALADVIERLKDAAPVDTVAGVPLGTPAYMPPEQALGEVAAIDERSDVYSLGAILYEILTGREPFSGATAAQVIGRVLSEPLVAPGKMEPACPAELADITMRAMARDRQARYRDATELAADVRAFMRGGLVGAHRYGLGALFARFLRRHRAPLCAALAVLAVGLGAWWYRGHQLAHAQARAAQGHREAVLGQVDGMLDETARGATQERWLDAFTFKLIVLRDPVTENALVGRLVAALAHDSADVRRLAARTLGGMNSRQAVPALGARLAPGVESSPEVLVEVIGALGVLGDPRAERPVREARLRLGQSSPLWDRTELAYRMIPLPELAGGGAGLDAAAWVDRGDALVDKGAEQDALAAYERALYVDPRSARAYHSRAGLRRSRGDWTGALDDYNQALDIEPARLETLEGRALLRAEMEDYRGAQDDYGRLGAAAGELSVARRRNLAGVHRRFGNFDAAIAELDQAVALAPNDARSHSALGITWAWMQQWLRALGAFDRAVALSDEYESARVWRAYVHQVRGNAEAALADLDRILQDDPSNDTARRQRASLRLVAGDRKGARMDLDHCIVNRCGQAGAREAGRFAQRGVVYFARVGDFDAALLDLERALRATQSAEERTEIAFLGLAVALRTGRTQERASWLGRLVSGNAESWHDRRVAVVRAGEPASALATRTFAPERRCLVALGAGVQAELGAGPAAAFAHYESARAIQRPTDLGCVLASVAELATAHAPGK
ncbi:MAG: protein kinase [Deltaproteobacteria bacterium]|nr:protein kinase [Deltaproteobacteria bacterium]